MVPWTPFQGAYLTEEQQQRILMTGNKLPVACLKNSRYEVWIYEHKSDKGYPTITQLSIKRLDKEPIRCWRDLQRIKNEVLGPNIEGVELYPSEERLVDTSNQFHIFCLPGGMYFPFGYTERLVMEGSVLGAKQEPWPEGERPADLTKAPETEEELEKVVEELRRHR